MTKKTVVSIFDMGRILKALGIDAKEKGDEWKALCPGHYARLGKIDRSPSWSINGNTGAFNCFSCGYSGVLVGLITDATDMSMWEATRWLRDEGFQSLDIIDEFDEGTLPTNLVPEMQDVWHMFDPPPQSMLRSRHLTMSAAMEYDLRWGQVSLSENRSTEDGWCIPIKTWRGDLLGYQWKSGGHVLNHPEGLEKSSTLFGIDTFPAGETVLLVESPLDVMRMWCCGYDGGLASFGAFVSDVQLELVNTVTDRLIIALDNDGPGRSSSRKLYERLRFTIPTVRFLDYKQCARRADATRPKDPGEMTERELHAAILHAKLGPEAINARLMPAELPKKKREEDDVRRPALRAGNTRRSNNPANAKRSAQGRGGARKARRNPARKQARRR